MEREAVLMKIKAAENEAKARRDSALKRARDIREKAAREAALLISSAEKEGQELMKASLKSAREEAEAARQVKMQAARKQGEQLESEAMMRIDTVAHTVLELFMREHHVED